MRSMKLFISSAALCALAACGGSDGGVGIPGVDATPAKKGHKAIRAAASRPSASSTRGAARSARELDIVVTTEAMRADQQPALDFGTGIKVTKVQAASASAIYAHLEIEETAALGPRDVKVTAGGKTVTGAKAFEVLAPAKITVLEGKAEQSGLAIVDLTNQDTSAFDDFYDAGFPSARDPRDDQLRADRAGRHGASP